jgi:hypothetical protein
MAEVELPSFKKICIAQLAFGLLKAQKFFGVVRQFSVPVFYFWTLSVWI